MFRSSRRNRSFDGGREPSALAPAASSSSALCLARERRSSSKKDEEELLVFGYSCKLFNDDAKARWIQNERHLIAWNGDRSLLIDRYDCRLHLSDLKEYDAQRQESSGAASVVLSAEEAELEKQLEEERYRDMLSDPDERLLLLEEEMKRYQASHGIRGAEFALDYSNEISDTLKLSASDEELSDDQGGKKCIIAPELKVPFGVETPTSRRQNTIIEKTAKFVAENGAQMEIIINAKQKGNKQFRFLDWDHPYHRYYKYVLKMIKDKKYEPKLDQPPDSESSSDEDDDGGYLHPSLLAGGRADSAEGSTSSDKVIHESFSMPNLSSTVTVPKPDYRLGEENDMYSQLYNRLTAVFPTLAKQTPVSKDGSGGDYDDATEEEGKAWADLEISQSVTDSTNSWKQPMAAMIPPPPDVQPVVDRLAEYVARNGPEFENMVRMQQDPRFIFVEPDSPYYGYYQAKVRWFQYEDYMTKYYHGAGEWFLGKTDPGVVQKVGEDTVPPTSKVTTTPTDATPSQTKPVIEHPWCSAEGPKSQSVEDTKEKAAVTKSDLMPLSKPSSVSISFSIKSKDKHEPAAKLKKVSCGLSDDSDEERPSPALPLPDRLSQTLLHGTTETEAGVDTVSNAECNHLQNSVDRQVTESQAGTSVSMEDAVRKFNGTASLERLCSTAEGSSIVNGGETEQESRTDELLDSFFDDILESHHDRKPATRSLQSDRRNRARLFVCKLRKIEENRSSETEPSPLVESSEVKKFENNEEKVAEGRDGAIASPWRQKSPATADLPSSYARHKSDKKRHRSKEKHSRSKRSHSHKSDRNKRRR